MSGPTPIETVNQDPAYPPQPGPPPPPQPAPSGQPPPPYPNQPSEAALYPKQPGQSGGAPGGAQPQPPPYGQQPPPQGPPPPGPAYGQQPQGAGAPGYGHGPPPPKYSNQGAPYGYRQPPQAGQVTIVASTYNAGNYGNGTQFGDKPVRMDCPQCRASITTSTTTRIGSMAWIAVAIIFFVGICIFPLVLLGCCFIPLCIPSLKDVEHSCPNCNRVLGSFKRGNTL